jgi:hypothetical protein
MLIRVGLENTAEGKSIAWALDHPGCFADGDTALSALPAALRTYSAWLSAHLSPSWLPDEPADIRLEDTG